MAKSSNSSKSSRLSLQKPLSFKDKFLSINCFQASFQRNLDGDQRDKGSVIGSICSIVAFLGFVFISSAKITRFATHQGQRIQRFFRPQSLSEDFYFGPEDGFNFAFALASAYDGKIEQFTMDESVGQLVLQSQEWSVNSINGLYYEQTEQINSRVCSRNELGFSGENQIMWPLKNRREAEQIYNFNNFLCVDDPNDAIIYGDHDSEKARFV